MRVERVILNEKDSLRRILEALDNNLTLADNFHLKSIEQTTPTAVGQEFTVRHSLGYVPTTFIATLDAPGFVYASRRESWDKDFMYLKSSVSNVRLYLLVL